MKKVVSGRPSLPGIQPGSAPARRIQLSSLNLYPARGEMRRSGKGGRASVRAGGDRRRLGRSLALPSDVQGREGEPPCEPAGIGEGSEGASPSQATFREGRASLRASRRGSEKARRVPRPPKRRSGKGGRASVRAGGDRRRLGGCLALPSDVQGREGEPPCEPAGIGEGSDGASPSQATFREGRASLRASRRGSEKARRVPRPPKRRSGKGGRASVRAGGDRRRLGGCLALPSDVRGREGEPPCEPAGIGEGSDGASPSQATFREGRASLRASRRGPEKARTEPRPPKRRSGKGGRASVRAGGDRRRLGRSLALPSDVQGREGEPPCEPAGIGEGSEGASPSQATFREGRASLRASRRGSEKARRVPRPPKRRSGKGGRASVRAGGDRRRLGRSLALPSDVQGREGEPPCEPTGIGEGSDGASPSQATFREGRASLRASRRGSEKARRVPRPPKRRSGKGGRASVRADGDTEKARTEPRPPKRRSGKGGRASVRAGGDRRRLGGCLALPSDVRGREGEPPCEPAGTGEGSDGASPSQATFREGRASLRASRRGSEKARTEPRPPKRRSGKGGRASVRAGGDRRRLGGCLALPSDVRGREGEPPCEPAGTGEGSEGASPSQATFGEGRASLRASRRGPEKARTEPRPPKMAQSRPREV